MKRKNIIILLVLILISFMNNSYAMDEAMDWTEEEILFMKNNPIIRLGVDPKFVPFEFIDDNGEHKGIAADYLKLVSEKTGLQFEVQEGLTWPEAYDLALRGEIDALPAVGMTPERLQNFLLSEPYYYFKRVIATRDTDTDIGSLAD